jgi:acetyl esterase/lipase
MKTILVKWIFTFLDFIGRVFIYNSNPPAIKKAFYNIAYNNSKKNRLDIFVPPKKQEFYPILLFIHGGGWLSGSKDSCKRICKIFASHGYLTFNVNYRLGPKHKYYHQLKDISDAIYWVFKNAPDYTGDINNILLAGESAGAHLTSIYITTLYNNPDYSSKLGIKHTIPKEKIKGILLYYGIYNFETILDTRFPFIKIMASSFLGIDISKADKEFLNLVSPIKHLSENIPNIFLCASESDRLFSQTLEFSAALQKKDIKHKCILFFKNTHPEGHHAFLNFYKKRCSKIAIKETFKFLKN